MRRRRRTSIEPAVPSSDQDRPGASIVTVVAPAIAAVNRALDLADGSDACHQPSCASVRT